MTDLTNEELERYSRHIMLKEVGIEGQKKIKNGKVLIIGAGGLGAPVALYLAAAGVGTIGIADGDIVDLSNLQRQVIHSTENVGTPKVESAKEKILAINPNVKVVTYQKLIKANNILDIIKDYDFIVDATDNFDTKYVINDACVEAGKAFSHGSIFEFTGQTFTYLPTTACYRCFFETPPTDEKVVNSSKIGIFGAIAGMLGTIQAAEVLKYLTGVGELLTDCLLTFDAKTMEFRKFKIKKNMKCPICGENGNIHRE